VAFPKGHQYGYNGDRVQKGQSVVSNGRKLLRGIKMTTAAARRYKDLIALYSAGLTNIGAYESTLLKLAAGMTVQAEAMQVKILQGEPLDEKKLVRVANTVARTLKTLADMKAKAASAASGRPDDLEAHMAQIVARREAKREAAASEAPQDPA
jgi:hypothetical protein